MLRKKITALLCLMLLLAAAIPAMAFAVPEQTLHFVLTNATYLNNESQLQVDGYYVNVGNRPVVDIPETYLEIYDGAALVAKGSYKKTTIEANYVAVGGARKAQIIMETPEKYLKLKDLKATAVMTASFGDSVTLASGKKVFYNAVPVVYDVQPAVVNGRLMVPARSTFEIMSATVDWNGESKTVTVKRGNQTVMLVIDSDIMRVNGTPIKLDAPAQIIDGRTLVPLRAISSALGEGIMYGAENEIVTIYSVK